jgi:hypothetical protein
MQSDLMLVKCKLNCRPSFFYMRYIYFLDITNLQRRLHQATERHTKIKTVNTDCVWYCAGFCQSDKCPYKTVVNTDCVWDCAVFCQSYVSI